ncbi:MAG: ABC transporter substrate-binding protein [Chitinophagales bacterium]
MKNLKTCVVGLMVMITLIFSGCQSSKTDTDNLTVEIACNLPLTGELATYGTSVRDGSNLAIDDLSDSLKTNKLVLNFDFQDNGGLAKNAVSIYQKQILNEPHIYESGVSPQTMAVIDLVSETKIPHFVWVYAPYINDKYPNTFRAWLDFKEETEYYLKYAKHRQPKKVAIVYVNIEVCQTEFDSIVAPGLKSQGINDIMIERYDITTSDFKTLASKVKDYNPDLILLNGFKDHMIQLIKDFRTYNLIKNGNTICSYDLLDAAPELSNDLLEGLRYTVPYFIMHQDDPKIKEWRKRFKEKFNREPLYTDAYAYDKTLAIYYASKNLDKPFNYDEMTKALLKSEFDGITGPFKFEQNGDLLLNLEIGYYENGILKPQFP